MSDQPLKSIPKGEDVEKTPRRPPGPPLRLSDSGRRWVNRERKPYIPAEDTPPLSIQETLQRMPNYERLTPSEKWIYGKLPAVTESGVGKALEWFGNSWAGKALSYLDVPAELLERGAGMAAQYLYSLTEEDGGEGFRNNLADAWYAGGLAADMMNLPNLKRDDEGNVTGIAFPTDLPGIGGIVEARRKISQLADQGVDRGEALQQVREGYYNDLGALQLRAQLFDMYVHVAGDPLNYILPAVKPIERVNAARKIAVSGKLLPGSLDELANLADIAKTEGRLEDAANITARINNLQETGKTLDLWDKAAIFVTGGDPLNPNWLGKQRWWPLSLTPEARAYELMTTVGDHIGSHILSRFDDPVDIVNIIDRASRQALGPEFQHAFLSVEGRTVQGFMGLADTQAKSLLDDWIKIRPERRMLDDIANALDEHPAKIIETLQDNPATIPARLANLGDEGAELAGRLTDDVVENLKALDGLPYTQELFKYYLNNNILDAVAKQGVIQFGVKSRGLLNKVAYTVKSAETLAFLRLNPGFAARNFVNNEFTMIARGVGGVVRDSQVDELIEILGYEPYRATQAFSMSGEPALLGAEASRAGQAIADALKGEDGFLNRAQDWMQSIELPKAVDMGFWATRAEASASKRAFYKGYMQGWNRYFWRPGKGFTRVRDAIDPELAVRIGDDILNTVEDAVSGAYKEADIAEKVRGNLNHTPTTILRDAAEEMGVPLERIFQPEYIARIENELPEALEKGPRAVRDLFSDLRTEQSNHIQQLTEAAHDARIAYFENLVGSEGPSGLLMAWGDMTDEFAGSHAAHFMRMERLSAGEIDWVDEFAQTAEFYERAWSRFEDGLQGMSRGAKKLGFEVPDEVTDSFTQWRRGWQGFHEWKRSLYDEFFSTPRAERTTTFAELRQQVSGRYTEMVDLERQLTMQMDDRITAMIRDANPDLADAFASWRARSAQIRDADKQAVIEFFDNIDGVSPAERNRLFVEFHRERLARWEDLWRNERAGVSMLQGDPVAREALERMQPFAGDAQQVRTIANRYGIPTITEEGVPMDQRVVNTVNKYVRGEYTDEAIEGIDEFARLEDIPPDVAADAFEARRAFRGEEPLEVIERTPVEIETVPGTSDVLKDSMYPKDMSVPEDQLWYQRGYEALDNMERQALDAQARPPLMWDDLDDEATQALERYLTTVRGQMSDAKYAATRFGEFKRDAALLNYNRRYNYNTFLSVFMPFEFWMTQSVAKWALHSIDRPAMLTSFLRLKKFIETAGAPQEGFPTRLQGTIRINMPFLPEWMGDNVFIDPLRTALPFDTMATPVERYITDQHRLESRAERLIQEKMSSGALDMAAGQQALETHAGTVWENALAETQANDANDRNDMFDLVNLFASMHAPLVWAKHAIEGEPEKIGPLTPASRTVKQFFGLFGVDLPHAKYNVWGNVRKSMGLPAFDRWDEYRVDRMLSNMAADGVISTDQALRAMINREGPVFDEAASRAAREFAGGGAIPFLLKNLGIPTQTYPEGEFIQRSLQDDFSRAYEAYDNGDVDALTKFFDEHPEYETRLALWDEPEERLQRFLVDEIWDRYRDMPKLHKDELREQLGPMWNNAFLNKETRNYDAIPTETLQIWLKLMGGDPPGSLSQEPVPLDMAPPEIAWRAQVFYDIRNEAFPNWYKLQQDYFKLDKDARKDFINKNGQLKQYWDWRRDFFHRNPEVVPYLSDDFEFQYPSEEALRQFEAYQPNYTWNEWQYILSPATARVIVRGDVPDEGEEYLTDIAQDLGMTYEEMLQRVRASAGQ